MQKLPSFNEYLRTVDTIPQINGGKPYKMDGVDIVKIACSLLDYIKSNGITFEEGLHPKVVFEERSESDKQKHPFFRRTGHYDPFINTIVIYTGKRDIKDILRSLAHEIVHADQYLNMGWDLSPAATGLNGENSDKAEEIEGDAYRRGNLFFRGFEDTMRPNWQ